LGFRFPFLSSPLFTKSAISISSVAGCFNVRCLRCFSHYQNKGHELGDDQRGRTNAGRYGVIISIVYLAAQIRNQNKESRRAAMNVLTTHWSDLTRTLVENSEMAVLFLRAMKSFDELDGASKLSVGAHLGRFMRFADSLYLGVLDGTLDRRLWRGYERTLADTAAYPGFQACWATRKHWHTDEFCALIDRHIQTAKPKIFDSYSLP
jgi:hypothetical protein